MTCANCVNSVEGILKKLPGVKGAVVALATSLGEVEYVPSAISKDEIVQAIEDAGFEAAFLQSSEQDKILLGLIGLHTERDVEVLHDILKKMDGLRQFDVNTVLSEVEIVFDPEAVGLRSIVDTIEMGSNGRLKAQVQNPYTRGASNDAQEASKMLNLLRSSLFLSVSFNLTSLFLSPKIKCSLGQWSKQNVCLVMISSPLISLGKTSCTAHPLIFFILIFNHRLLAEWPPCGIQLYGSYLITAILNNILLLRFACM